MGYKSALEEGVGALPTMNTSKLPQDHPTAAAKEGWALRAAKKTYRFSDKQKSYLLAKFRIGQTTDRKLDAEVVAREMRRARGADCLLLFQTSEFLTASQIASYFSRLNAAARQQDVDDLDIQASEEETNFTGARDAVVTTSQIQHPITYDQFDLCSMAKGEEDAQVTDAAAFMRGPGPRCTTASRRQESPLYGATKGHNKELFLSRMNKPNKIH